VKKSLSTRLMYSFMAIIVVVITGITAGTSYLIADYFFKNREQELADKGREMADTIEYFVQHGSSRLTLLRYLTAVDRLVGARIWLFGHDYNLLATSDAEPQWVIDPKTGQPRLLNSPEPGADSAHYDHTRKLAHDLKEGKLDTKVKSVLAGIYGGKSVRSQIYHPYFKQQVILVGIPYGKTENLQGAILLAEPLSGFDKFLRNVYLYTIIVGILALLFSLFLVRQLSLRIIEPLVDMRDATKAIASGDYTQSVHVTGEDEVAELGGAINDLRHDLSAYVDKLQKMDKIRSDFVANVSHELRTPITIIRGYAEIISDNMQESPVNERYCQLIRSETERLERLVRNLLNISRLQAADELKPAETTPLPLADIIRTVAENLQVKALEKNITIRQELFDDVRIIGDGDQIVQLVLIFGDNAIKYSPEGSYVLYKMERIEGGALRLHIQDNGSGIPETDLPFIFERFYKVDKSHSKSKTQGTGLGLAIAKEIIRMHGAAVEVKSELGCGTDFIITFPQSKVLSEQAGGKYENRSGADGDSRA